MNEAIQVAVTAFRFNREGEAIPRRIELDGISYDVSDENAQEQYSLTDADTAYDVRTRDTHFKLVHEATSLTWRLLAITSAN